MHPVTQAPFTLHEVWSETKRMFEYEIRHGSTVQARYRYSLHGQKVVEAWNALIRKAA